MQLLQHRLLILEVEKLWGLSCGSKYLRADLEAFIPHKGTRRGVSLQKVRSEVWKGKAEKPR